MKNIFYGKDILSAGQFDQDDIEIIMQKGKEMEMLVKSSGGSDILKGKLMTALFYEPSSRTFGSFISSMQRLGGSFIPLQGVTYSSVSKGESLPDTVRTFASYSDVIVIRHPEVGSARIAADFTDKPVINAGDGVGEHPSQALLDFYTIHNHFDIHKSVTVTMIGDLMNGRTIHSLIRLLCQFPKIKLNFVSPVLLKLPQELAQMLRAKKVHFTETEKLAEVLGTSDVLYVTRVQKERFTDLSSYEKLKHMYIVTKDVMKKLKKTSIVMHPFPRVGEIEQEVDLDPRAVYIREQMTNGMYVRMALLSLVLSK